MALTPIAYALQSHSIISNPSFNCATQLKKISDDTTYALVQGDMVIVVPFHSGTAGRTLAQLQPSGSVNGAYSSINASVIQSNDTDFASMSGFYSFMGATPDATISLPACAATTNTMLIMILVYQGVDPSAPFAGVTPVVQGSAINGAKPDAGSITTPARTGCHIVAFGGQAQATGAALTVPTTTAFDATTRYTGLINATTATNDAAGGYGIKTGVAASTAFDPSTWNGGTTANTDSSCSLIFVLQPVTALTPALFTSSPTFPAATVGATNSIAPGLVSSGNTLYAGTISASNTLSPNLLSSGLTFYSPTVTAPPNGLQPSLFTNTNNFYTPTVSATYTITPALQGCTGANKVANGDFATDVSSWNATSAAVTISQVSGRARVTRASGSGNDGIYQAIPTVIGQAYRVTADTFPGTATTRVFRVTSSLGSGNYFSLISPTSVDRTFVATTTTTYIELDHGTSTVGSYVELDNVTLTETQNIPAVLSTLATLQPSVVNLGQSFYAPIVGAGTVNLAPGQLVNSNSFPTATVSSLSILAPARITTGSLLSPTVSATYTLSPALFTNPQSFKAPVVAVINQITPSLLTTGTIQLPTVSSLYTLTAPKLTLTQTFYSPSIFNTQSVLPGLFTNSQSFKVPSVTPGPVSMTPSLLATGTIPLPTVLNINALLPPKLTNAQTFPAPSVLSSYSLLAPQLGAGGSIKLPSVTNAFILRPPLLANVNGFPSPYAYQPLHFASGYMPPVDLVWLGKVRPQVFLSPPSPDKAIDDPVPPVHDTFRY